MFKEIRIAHCKPLSLKPVTEGEMPSMASIDHNIERVVWNEQQYDNFVREFWKQNDFLMHKGYEPKQIIISLQDYKNLLAFEQTTKVERFLGLPIVVDRFANHTVKVLPSPEDQMALYYFIKEEEE